MALNEQQIEAVQSNERTILVLACAGAGKSTVLVNRIKRLVDEGVKPWEILALTFTNAAAFEMGEKYRRLFDHEIQHMPEFRTFHSFCYSLLIKDKSIREKLGYTKVPVVCDDAKMKEVYKKAKMLTNCDLSEAKMNGQVKLTAQEKFKLKLYNKAVKQQIQQENIITFDMLCYNICELFKRNAPEVQKYKEKYKHVLIDEFQDTDPKQFQFISSFPETCSIFAVGDALQCQPAGTKVMMADKSLKNIEDIVPGDAVMSYLPQYGCYTPKYAVTAVEHHFDNDIVEVSTQSHSSKYTKSHLTYAKIHFEGNENVRVIYLANNSEKGFWRIGECSLISIGTHDIGHMNIMREERPDRVWILDVIDEPKSMVQKRKQAYAYKFGIPVTTWQFENAESTQGLYDAIPNIEQRAIQCLEYFGRDIRFPFFDTADDNSYNPMFHKFEIHVSNLIPRIMDVVVPAVNSDKPAGLQNTSEQIMKISPCEGAEVYSLNVEGSHNYIGDGILTHNCIYQFRNCSNEYVKMLSTAPGWQVIRLYKNYRSTTQICEFANKFSKYAKPEYRVEMEGQFSGDRVEVIPGSHVTFSHPVDTYHLSILMERLMLRKDDQSSCAVLCRTNKEAKVICEELDSKGIKYTTSSKSTHITEVLRSCIDNEYMLQWLSTSLTDAEYGDYIRLASQEEKPDIRWFLTTYKHHKLVKDYGKKVVEIRKILNKSIELEDKFDLVTKLLKIKTKSKFDKTWTSNKELIEGLLEQTEGPGESPIYVGTIHSSKGLEYDSVYVIGADDGMFQLNSEEMKNLYYVAITRAKNHLVVFKY